MSTTAKHPVPASAQMLTTTTVTGTHSLTGKRLTYTVTAYVVPDANLPGRWIVALNGCVIRWYAMELPALRCIQRACVGAYGISFGEAF